jgi:hypothetical protein
MKFVAATIAIAAALGFASEAFPQARHDEKPHGMGAPSSGSPPAQPSVSPSDPSDQTILLKDGGTLILRSDGTAYHADAKGNRVRMKDGVMMEAKDGTKYMMRNDAIWQTISQKGTMHPNHQ